MFWRKGFMLFLMLSLLLFVLNFIARKKMMYSYAGLVTYDQLYVMKEQLKVSQISENKDHSVTLAFSGKGVREVNECKVYADNRLVASTRGPKCTFHPLAGSKKYIINLNGVRDDIVLDLSYTPDSVLMNAGNSTPGGCELININIPIQRGPLYSVNDWKWPYNRFESDDKEAAGYLKDSIKIGPADAAMTRVIKIARFILERTKGMDGTPSDSMIMLSPINQLKCVQAGRSRMRCGLYSEMFIYFATKAGVPCRLIQCGDGRLNISSGIHVFNEVYIEEYEKWLYLDLLAKTIFVKKGELYLNAADIHRLLKYGIEDTTLKAAYFNGDSIVQTPFNQVASTARYYFHQNNNYSYYFGDYLKIQTPRSLMERGKKAFYSKPYYALYGDNISPGKWQFVFRIATTYTLMLSLVFCLFFGFRAYKRKRK